MSQLHSAIKYLEIEKEIHIALETDLEIILSPNKNCMFSSLVYQTSEATNRSIQECLRMRKEYAKAYTCETNPDNKKMLLESFLMANKNILLIIGMSVPQND